MDWILALVIYFPNGEEQRLHAPNSKPNYVECNKLKLNPERHKAARQYAKMVGAARYRLECIGIPKKKMRSS